MGRFKKWEHAYTHTRTTHTHTHHQHVSCTQIGKFPCRARGMYFKKVMGISRLSQWFHRTIFISYTSISHVAWQQIEKLNSMKCVWKQTPRFRKHCNLFSENYLYTKILNSETFLWFNSKRVWLLFYCHCFRRYTVFIENFYDIYYSF